MQIVVSHTPKQPIGTFNFWKSIENQRKKNVKREKKHAKMEHSDRTNNKITTKKGKQMYELCAEILNSITNRNFRKSFIGRKTRWRGEIQFVEAERQNKRAFPRKMYTLKSKFLYRKCMNAHNSHLPICACNRKQYSLMDRHFLYHCLPSYCRCHCCCCHCRSPPFTASYAYVLKKGMITFLYVRAEAHISQTYFYRLLYLSKVLATVILDSWECHIFMIVKKIRTFTIYPYQFLVKIFTLSECFFLLLLLLLLTCAIEKRTRWAHKTKNYLFLFLYFISSLGNHLKMCMGGNG